MSSNQIDGTDELDLRHQTLAAQLRSLDDRFSTLARGETLTVVLDSDPGALRAAFDVDNAGCCKWTVARPDSERWMVTIVRSTTSDRPRLLGNTHDIVTKASATGTPGAVWKLTSQQRQLDSNIVHLPPHESVGKHTGSDVDVLVIVLAGAGVLGTETGDVALAAGALGWLPRRSSRSITAGADGLTYVTVHRRRAGLTIGRRPSDGRNDSVGTLVPSDEPPDVIQC